MGAREIVKGAVQAKTFEEAEAVQSMIAAEVGRRFERPLGDRWNNYGLLAGAGGSYDTKLVENVTNMQDAVLERAALERFGDYAKVPYENPREAARALLDSADYRTLADDIAVEFHESDPPASRTKRLTALFRDRGCGMTPEQVPRTIFGIGSSHKVELPWFQGAFGLGGETTFRNALAVVLVSRRAPELLKADEDDRITVAVLLWEQRGKSRSAYYLVTSAWAGPGDYAVPYSVPAHGFPGFEPGTHLALISYGVERYHRARGGGDEGSFEAVLNTRLFDPVAPVRFRNAMLKKHPRRGDYLRGLRRRLEDNPRADRREGRDVLPLRINGETYHLPIQFYVFSKRGERGERRNFVARDHAVLFTSNGQVHYHWSPHQFRYKTTLSKLHDRILVVVDTDELPIETRNTFFTADRSQLVRNETAIRLEEHVAGFVNEWTELRRINAELIRDAIRSDVESQSTLDIARRISRALRARGFSLRGRGTSGGGTGSTSGGRTPTPIDLYNDPTTLEGPERVVAEQGKTKFVTFVLNAVDGFVPRRGQLEVRCDHPDISDRDVTIGPLKSGHIRVSVAVPLGADLGEYKLQASLANWLKSSGGLGTRMDWTTQFQVVEEGSQGGGSAGGKGGHGGATKGETIALIWDSHETHEGWQKTTVGDVELVPAGVLSQEHPEYAGLADLGDTEVPTLLLNREYHRLKDYIGARVHDLSEDGLERKREQYAVGTGVGLYLVHAEMEQRRKEGTPVPERWLRSTQQAVARSVLSMMPYFDMLAKEAGLEE